MNRTGKIGLIVVLVAVALPMLTGCRSSAPLAQGDLTLAARVPGTAELIYFWDVKPQGALAEHWSRVRKRVEAHASGRETLDSLLQAFELGRYGLEGLAAGPSVVATWQQAKEAEVVIIQVMDEQAAHDAALRSLAAMTAGREELDGKTLYYGASEPQRIAWTVDRGVFIYVSSPAMSAAADHSTEQSAPLTVLREVVNLAESDSLAAQPAWQTLRGRLPQAPIGLLFVNLAKRLPDLGPEEAGQDGALLALYQMPALALAAMPDADGVRIDIAGLVEPSADALPSSRALFSQPPIDPATWLHLPGNSALALLGHDAPVLWPFVQLIFGLGTVDPLRDVTYLDVTADLMAPGGPLAGELAVAVLPPLPNQPISRGMPAFQALIVARGTTPEQMDQVRVAMEGRGAAFALGHAGVPVRVQAGTEASGYALTYGFDAGTLLLGTSPTSVEQGVTAARARYGLTQTDAFRAVSAAWPADPTLILYVDVPQWTALNEANSPGGQAPGSGLQGLEAFQAAGLGMRFRPDGMDGVAYLLLLK